MKKLILPILITTLISFLAAGQSISPSGAFIYSIPISIPDGTHGMAPALSLDYNSQGGNSITGMGWQIDGIQFISRDDSYPIRFDGNDHYTYMGSKLIYNSTTGRYHTEYETYSRIEAYNMDSATSYWLVTLKDGTKMYFGNTPDSHIDAIGKGGKALLWVLNKVIDTNGNYYTIEYSEDPTNGDYYPLKITYTKNDAYPIPGQCTVDFGYESRSDHHVRYEPTKVDQDQRLKWVTVKIGGNLLRKYRLDYEYSPFTFRSRLITMQEYGSDGLSTLPARTFTYKKSGDPDASIKVTNWSTGWQNWINQGRENAPASGLRPTYHYGDFNGDGKTDIALSNNGFTTIPVYFSNGDGSFTITNWATPSGQNWINEDRLHASNPNLNTVYHIGDFNGDGKTDIALSNDGWGSIPVYFSNGDGSFTITNWATPFGQNWINENRNGLYLQDISIYHYGDFNGDGRMDIAVGHDDWTTMPIYFSNGDGTFTIRNCSFPAGQNWINQGLENSDVSGLRPSFHYGDINGDGKTDIALSNNGFTTIPVYFSNGDGSFTITNWSNPYGQNWINEDRLHTSNLNLNTVYHTGDFNGDGKMDIALSNDGWGSIPVYFSNGDGSFTITNFQPSSNLINEDRVVNRVQDAVSYHSGDFNGDGKTDIALSNDGWTAMPIYFSNGDGTFTMTNWSNPAGQNWINEDRLNEPGTGLNVTYHYGDFDGDGKTDIALSNDGWTTIPVYSIQAPSENLVSVNNGIGGTISIAYQQATQATDAVKPNLTSYPTVANNIPRSLVTSFTLNDGLGGSIVTNYTYCNGKYLTGTRPVQKNLGFQWIKKTDAATGNYTITNYRQDPPYQGLVDNEASYDAAGTIFSKTQNALASLTDPGSPAGVVFVYNMAKTCSSYNTKGWEIVTGEVYNYDAYGNVYRVYKLSPSNYYDLRSSRMETLIDFCYDTTNWILCKPKQVKVSGNDINDSWVTQKITKYYYDNQPSGYLNQKANLTQETVVNGTNEISITHSYDNWGNRLSSANPRNYSSTIELDPIYHKYPVSMTNPKGYKSYTYYDSLMREIEKNDINGVSSYESYDVFSRKINSYQTPDTPTYPSIILEYYFDGAVPEYITMKQREDSTSTNNPGAVSLSRKFFDGLGRVIQEKKVSNGTSKCYTVDTYYDNSGRVAKVSIPYYTNSFDFTTRDTTQKCVLKEYDALNREIKATAPDGTSTQLIYDCNVVKEVDANGHVKTKKYDGLGKIIEVCEYTGVYPNETVYSRTMYKYNTGTGQLVQITDSARNVTAITYDMAGRKIGETDPDLGTITYTYDANGNMLSKTDAKIQTISYTYDELDRITKIDYPTGTDTLFYYDESGHGYSKGRLTRVTYADGSESYNYDARGNKTSTAVTINGVTKSESFAFDSQNRLKKITYPDGEQVNYCFDTSGNINSVVGVNNEDGCSLYVSSCNYNAFGNVTDITYNNYHDTVYYDFYDTADELDPSSNLPYSYRLKKIYTSNPGIYNMQYEYDKVGNIKKKTDLNNANYSEIFTYDDLDRLTNATSGAYGALNYTYNNIGNITSSNAGQYIYGTLATASNYDDETGETTYWTYYVSKHCHAVDSVGSETYEYDANGNMISKNGQPITYNYDNMPVSIVSGSNTSTFKYFGNKRVQKVEGGVTTNYFFDNYEECGTTKWKYYYINGQKFAQRSSTEGLLYIFSDHLGSTTKLVDKNGILVKSIGYKPYGEDSYNLNLSGNYTARYKFTGQELDSTGLYYYGARYYLPGLGRFASADSMIADVYNPQQLNRYSYCLNNPLAYIDPTGNFSLGKLFKTIAKVVVAIVAVVVLAYVCPPAAIGAALGGISGGVNAAIYGGDIGNGVLLGAACGGISGAIGAYMPIDGVMGAAIKGGLSGGINSAIRGGNIAKGMLFGAVSAGVSAEVGGFLQDEGVNCYVTEVASNMAGGAAGAAVTGGSITDAITGSFTASAMQIALGASQYCFIAGTKIETKEGLKNIEDIKKGDIVKSMNPSTGEFDYKEVLRTFINHTEKIAKVKVGNETIESTPGHEFWVVNDTSMPAIKTLLKRNNSMAVTSSMTNDTIEGIWLSAEDLKPGMKLQLSNGKRLEVTSVTIIPKIEAVYNFEVADWHNYCVGEQNIVVHNFPCGPDGHDKENGDCKLDDDTQGGILNKLRWFFNQDDKALYSQHALPWKENGEWVSQQTAKCEAVDWIGKWMDSYRVTGNYKWLEYAAHTAGDLVSHNGVVLNLHSPFSVWFHTHHIDVMTPAKLSHLNMNMAAINRGDPKYFIQNYCPRGQ